MSRAIFLTYTGVGAAFVVLGSLIVFTLVVGWLGRWRSRAAARPAVVEPAADAAPVVEIFAEAEPDELAPPLAAAIAAAVALAVAQERREREAGESRPADSPAGDGENWRSQGRLAAFDSRRLRDS